MLGFPVRASEPFALYGDFNWTLIEEVKWPYFFPQNVPPLVFPFGTEDQSSRNKEAFPYSESLLAQRMFHKVHFTDSPLLRSMLLLDRNPFDI